MSPTDKLMAVAQILLSALFLFFVFVITVIYELGLAHLTADQDRTFGSWMDRLLEAAAIVIFFWFQRARNSGIPDASQVVTRTHTLPDGTKTVITTPVVPPASAAKEPAVAANPTPTKSET